jgi:hypothetical protein
MTLEEFLSELAVELGATIDRTSPPTMEFRRDRRTFAVATGSTVDLRLDSEIAVAALGTPSTQASQRGPEWVRLTVDTTQTHDLDRARAWFLSAYRNAERS